MKKILSIILLFPLLIIAQTNSDDDFSYGISEKGPSINIPMSISQTNSHEISWNSNIIFESNNLDKSYLNSMLYAGYITDSMKSQWINTGTEKNILYAEISNEFSYTYYFNKQNIGFSIADKNFINIQLPDDLLRLTLEGNFNYQDQVLDFSHTNIRATRFQQYKLKYGRTINSLKIQSGISYLAGNHHLSYIIRDGSIYTAPFGTHLDIQYDMSSFITDTSDLSLSKHNGKGIAIEFSTDLNVKNYDIHFSISDLGFIIWNPSSITLATDSSFVFQGIEVEDILDFNDSLLEISTLENDLPKTNTNSFKSYIPATLHISLAGKTKNKYLANYTTGIITKWQPYEDNTPLSFQKISQGFKESNFSPLYYIKSIIRTKYLNIIPTLAYGGYNNQENIGLAISKGKKYKFVLGTHHLEDLFYKDKAKALSVHFNMNIQF
tara:strand:- start:830 stop:2140 length:1311 start_codon:yes stop_codon:yes gene_type:complete